MPWTVTLHREVAKAVQTLPQSVQDLLRLLLQEKGRDQYAAIGQTMANSPVHAITVISRKAD